MKISAKLRVVELRGNKQSKLRKWARAVRMWLVPGIAKSHRVSRGDDKISKNLICPERI